MVLTFVVLKFKGYIGLAGRRNGSLLDWVNRENVAEGSVRAVSDSGSHAGAVAAEVYVVVDVDGPESIVQGQHGVGFC